MNNNAIAQKLWSLCDILRDDGIPYHQYVTELTLEVRVRRRDSAV